MLRNSKHRATLEPHHPHVSHPAHTLHADSNDSLSLENTPEQLHRKFMPSPLKMPHYTPTLPTSPGTPFHGIGSNSSADSPMAAPSGKNDARVQPKLGANIYASNLKMMGSVDENDPVAPLPYTPKKW